MIGWVRRAATMAVASIAFMGLSAALPGSAPLTPEAAVETTRVLEDYDVLTSGATPVSFQSELQSHRMVGWTPCRFHLVGSSRREPGCIA